jgi:hypothetical protein
VIALCWRTWYRNGHFGKSIYMALENGSAIGRYLKFSLWLLYLNELAMSLTEESEYMSTSLPNCL